MKGFQVRSDTLPRHPSSVSATRRAAGAMPPVERGAEGNVGQQMRRRCDQECDTAEERGGQGQHNDDQDQECADVTVAQVETDAGFAAPEDPEVDVKRGTPSPNAARRTSAAGPAAATTEDASSSPDAIGGPWQVGTGPAVAVRASLAGPQRAHADVGEPQPHAVEAGRDSRPAFRAATARASIRPPRGASRSLRGSPSRTPRTA